MIIFSLFSKTKSKTQETRESKRKQHKAENRVQKARKEIGDITSFAFVIKQFNDIKEAYTSAAGCFMITKLL